MIHVDNVTKSYQSGQSRIEVLRGINCEIQRGQFVYVIGPSGSGKSTLLYLLGALDSPTSGEIRISDRKLSTLSDRERDEFRRTEVGFVFQNFNLLKNLDALDNILVPHLPGGCSAQMRIRAKELLQQIGLGDRLHHLPSRLSGGEQQRVAIARAVLKKPQMILADEPTGELDSHTGAAVFDLLRELNKQEGATVVTVTHDHRYIRDSDIVLEIEDGLITHANVARNGERTTDPMVGESRN